jgi:hypothetical protein
MWLDPLWELGIYACSLDRLDKACQAKSNSHACICTTQRAIPHGNSHHAFALSLLHVAPMSVCRVTRKPTTRVARKWAPTDLPPWVNHALCLLVGLASLVIEARSGNDHDNCNLELGQLQSA